MKRDNRRAPRFCRKFHSRYKNYLLIFAICAAIGFLLTVSPSGIAKLWEASKSSIFKQMFHYAPRDKERQLVELQKQMEMMKKSGQQSE